MKIFGLVGEKLSHSMSPEIHNEIFKLLNENAVYNLFEVDEDNVLEVGDALRVLNIKGINVTIPYKEELINSVDELSQEAEKIGAINTILNKDGVLKGYNTDYYGFGRMLKNFNVNLKNKVVVVLGNGGAAKAVVQYVADQNPKDILIVARNKVKAKNSFKKYDVINYDELLNIRGDIIINTTPVGMYPKAGVSVVDGNVIEKFNIAVDLIFNPFETEFLRIAREKGLKTIGGLYMLVGQAIKAEEIWLGKEIGEEDEMIIYKKLKYIMEGKN